MLAGVRTHSEFKLDMVGVCFDYRRDNKKRVAISGVTSILFLSATRCSVSPMLDERHKKIQR